MRAPIKWYLVLWCLFPLVLPLVGGLAGAVLGFFAAGLNILLVLLLKQEKTRFLATGALSAAAILIWMAVTPQEFRSEAGGFSVVSPVGLQETVYYPEASEWGSEVHAFSGSKGDTVYSVVYGDWPPEKVESQDIQSLLAENCDNFVAFSHGQLYINQGLTLDGYPGRECIALIAPDATSSTSRLYQGHTFLVGNRNYSISILRQQTGADPLKVDDFILSFTLLKP